MSLARGLSRARVTPAGLDLMDDADAAAQRTTLAAAEAPHITYGVVGDGTTDTTTAFYNFLNGGGGYLPSGTYIIGSGTVSSPFSVWCGPNVVIKQKALVECDCQLRVDRDLSRG